MPPVRTEQKKKGRREKFVDARFQEMDSRPPAALRHSPLAWAAACDVVGALNSLPIGIQLPRLNPHGRARLYNFLKEHPQFRGIELERASVPAWYWKKIHEWVTEPPPALPMDEFSKEVRDALAVIRVLIDRGHEAACQEFNRAFCGVGVQLPLIRSLPPEYSSRKITQGVAWRPQLTDQTTRRGEPYFPVGLSLWLILSEPGLHPRICQCAACHMYFVARTRHRAPQKQIRGKPCGGVVYCTRRCKRGHQVSRSRASSRK
jgi:hypothetical protein